MPPTHFFRKSAGPGFDVLVLIWSKDAPAKSNTTIPGHCNSLSNEADYIKASTILHVHRLPGPHRRITLIPTEKSMENQTLFLHIN